MKVAIVVRTLKIGGMERVAISLAKAFQDQGHDSHLIYFKQKKNTYTTDQLKNIHFWNLDAFLLKSGIGLFYELFIRFLNLIIRKSYALNKGFITSLIFQHKLKQLEKTTGTFDLIIIRGQGTFEFLWFNQDHRYIQVCENILYPNRPMNFFRKIHAKLLYNKKNIVCVSNGVLQSFTELEKNANLQAQKKVKITNPIDVLATQEASTEYQPDIDTAYIVSVGRLAPIKNFSLLIDAYAYIKSKYTIDYKLVIIGEGNEKTNLQKQIKSLKLENFVVLTGVVKNPYPWIANAELFVLSSKHEGLGMVLLEALACKTNLVVTKSPGGVTDIMKNELENFLCEPTIKDLGEKIYKEITNPSTIHFEKHLYPFLPTTITDQYIKEFL